MPTKTLLPPPYQTLLDIDGDAIANGTVTFLDAGTAVLAVVYADADGLVISANPLTVDAAGRYTVFLTPGQVVDVQYRDPLGALLKTVPGVQGAPSVTGNVDVSGTVGQAVTAGQLLQLSDGTSGAAGQWYLGNANVAMAVKTSIFGMALANAGAGVPTSIRTAGRVTGLSGLVVGALYYASNTLGALSLTPGLFGRVVGQADSTTSLMLYANPPELAPPLLQDYTTVGVVAQFIPTARSVRVNAASLLTIQGIRAGYHGQRVRFFCVAGAQVDFVSNSGAAGVNDRLFPFATSANTSLVAPRGVAEFEYDATTPGWRMVTHEQGGWITPAFSAADYFASGGMTWTVTAGQQSRAAYYLQGKVLRIQLGVAGAAIGGAPSVQLYRNIPGGFQTAGGSFGPVVACDGTGQLPSPTWDANATRLEFRANFFQSLNWALTGAGAYLYCDVAVEAV